MQTRPRDMRELEPVVSRDKRLLSCLHRGDLVERLVDGRSVRPITMDAIRETSDDGFVNLLFRTSYLAEELANTGADRTDTQTQAAFNAAVGRMRLLLDSLTCGTLDLPPQLAADQVEDWFISRAAANVCVMQSLRGDLFNGD